MATEVLDGKYALDELLGRGGMGEVYQGRNLVTGKRVAIKRLRDLPNMKEEVEERFVREARAASVLEHANVVQIFDVAQSNGSFYMVMELLRGESLAAYVEREAPVPAERAIAILLPALAALNHAHERNVIHRDLKPDNIFLSQVEGTDGVTPKLLDFGIAKILHDTDRLVLTKTGTVMGSPLYMSPEQTRDSGDVDARADIYAMGVILYEMLSGKRPFEASSYPALVYAIMHGELRPLTDLVPTLDPAVATAVHRAMSRERVGRPASAAVFANELRRAIGLPEVSDSKSAVVLPPSSRISLGTADTVNSRPSAPSAVPSQRPAPPRSPWLWALGALLLAVVGAGAYALITSEPASPPLSATEPAPARPDTEIAPDPRLPAVPVVPVDAAARVALPTGQDLPAIEPEPEQEPVRPRGRGKTGRPGTSPDTTPVEGLPFQNR